MKFFFFAIIAFFTGFNLFAAPLESGFAMAPRPSAPQDEKAHAYYAARQAVIQAARKYEGTPYVYGGITSRGLDCSGFICISFRDAHGLNLPRTVAGLYSWVERIPYDKAQAGDLLFFRTDRTRNVTHVGLYLGNRRFIHSASAGARTGVIYSSLDEQYWSRAFAGTGRVFPEGSPPPRASAVASVADSGIAVPASSRTEDSAGRINTFFRNVRLYTGAAFAPTWDVFYINESLIRGFASQICFSAEFGSLFGLGLELRPEYDSLLGVFRLPLTLSFDINDTFTIFAGPALSFGDAVITTKESQRNYSGGTSWFGTAGITVAPFKFNIAHPEFAPYIEAAWQSYFSTNEDFRFTADISACFRVSTGIKWKMQIR